MVSTTALSRVLLESLLKGPTWEQIFVQHHQISRLSYQFKWRQVYKGFFLFVVFSKDRLGWYNSGVTLEIVISILLSGISPLSYKNPSPHCKIGKYCWVDSWRSVCQSIYTPTFRTYGLQTYLREELNNYRVKKMIRAEDGQILRKFLCQDTEDMFI